MAQTLAGRLRLWAQKWRWYERGTLPWNRAAVHWEFMRREAFVRWPVQGNVLEALREGRLELGAGRAARAGRLDHGAGQRARAHRRGELPQQRRDGRRPGAGRDRRALHARQRLLRVRRRPPLRRPAAADHLAGLHQQGPHPHRRELLAGRQRRGHQRRHHRRALRDRGQLASSRATSPPSRSRRARRRRCCARSNTGSVRGRMDLYEAMRCAPTSEALRQRAGATRDARCGHSTPPASPPAAATARAGG